MASDRAGDGSIVGVRRASGEGRAFPCHLRVTKDGDATLSAGNTVFSVAPFSMLTISDRVGSIARHVTFPDGSDFETNDNDAIDALSKLLSGRSGAVHELERFRPRLIIVVALAMTLCFALYKFAVPILVEVAVATTPPVVARLLSQSVLASLDRTVFDKTELDQVRQGRLRAGFKQLADLTPGGLAVPAVTYTLNFRKGGTIGPNAFALPDGTVVLTDELVDLAKADDEMILGVLAHELGHVDHEHSLRQLYRAAGVTALIMLIGGDIGSGTEDILIQGSALLQLSYSRGAEREADRFSVDLMHAAGRDPATIARFFELIRDTLGDTGDGDFLSTHPATPERIAETRRYAAEVAASKP